MNTVQIVRKELKSLADPKLQRTNQRWFKEPIKCYGIPMPEVRKLAKVYYSNLPQATPSTSPLGRGRCFLKDLPKTQLFDLCDQLMRSGMYEEFFIASDWAFRRKKEFEASDFPIFQSWIEKYVSNWATCDDFCTKSLGYLILTFPELVPKIKTWTKSKNQWVRRACAVSLIVPVRRGKYLQDIFDVALDLMNHPEDMVQKGYGWMLKEASNVYPNEIFDFVMKHKARMTRTALRYAIEKMPKTWKQQAMK